MKIIFDYNRTIFDPEKNELYSGVLQLLEKLSLAHELFLVSMNELGRKNTIKKLNIEKFFKKIVFTNKKDTELFLSLVGNTKNVLIVGDSINNEILIGNNLRITTILIKRDKFSNEKPNSINTIPDFTILEMNELEEIIKKYEKSN